MKDSLLNIIQKKFSLSKKEATGLILSGNILVDEIVITKGGFKIDEDANIRIKKKSQFVSRGAKKLLCAFNHFQISVKNKICMDVGSSTGGFTEVLLLNGAKKVYCVDSGNNQLAYKLRTDSRVTLFENTRIQDLAKDKIIDKIEFIVMDVSFTSGVQLLPKLKLQFDTNEYVILIKPQFEYMRLKKILNLSKEFNGVITNDGDRDKIISHVKEEIKSFQFVINDCVESDIKGSKGNIEYLFYLQK